MFVFGWGVGFLLPVLAGLGEAGIVAAGLMDLVRIPLFGVGVPLWIIGWRREKAAIREAARAEREPDQN